MNVLIGGSAVGRMDDAPSYLRPGDRARFAVMQDLDWSLADPSDAIPMVVAIDLLIVAHGNSLALDATGVAMAELCKLHGFTACVQPGVGSQLRAAALARRAATA